MMGDDDEPGLGFSRGAGFSHQTPRRRRFRHVPLRIVLPNLITLLALCLGLTAIRFATEGSFEKAVFAIVAAAVFDGLDGRLARALKGTTRFGAELDSLADFVGFGVAPALTLYFWNMQAIKSFGWFAAMVFAIAMALRLARFNVGLDDPNKPTWSSYFFTGMPAPAGAIVALLPLYLHLSALGSFSTMAWWRSRSSTCSASPVSWQAASRISRASPSGASHASRSSRSCSALRLWFCC